MKISVWFTLVIVVFAVVKSLPKKEKRDCGFLECDKDKAKEKDKDYSYECEGEKCDKNFCYYCDEDELYPDEDTSYEYQGTEESYEDTTEQTKHEHLKSAHSHKDDLDFEFSEEDYEEIVYREKPHFEEEQGICRPNQTYVKYYADCFNKACCDNLGVVDVTRCFVIEGPACICKRGYIWDRMGRCIRLEDCPPIGRDLS